MEPLIAIDKPRATTPMSANMIVFCVYVCVLHSESSRASVRLGATNVSSFGLKYILRNMTTTKKRKYIIEF